eukprot:COSAG06_NODE_666_length_13272_cov_10.674334_1_plen_2097_part_10
MLTFAGAHVGASGCERGKYQANPGSVGACSVCPVHSTTTGTCSVSVTQCSCRQGYVAGGNGACAGRSCTGLSNVIKDPVQARECSGELKPDETCSGNTTDDVSGNGRIFPSVITLKCKDAATHIECGKPNAACDDTWECSNTTGKYVALHDPSAQASTIQCSQPSKIAHCPQNQVGTAQGDWGWQPPGCDFICGSDPNCVKCNWIRYADRDTDPICNKCEPGYTAAGCGTQTKTCDAVACADPAHVPHGNPIYTVAGKPVAEGHRAVFSGSATSQWQASQWLKATTTLQWECDPGYILTYDGVVKSPSPRIEKCFPSADGCSTVWKDSNGQTAKAPTCVPTCSIKYKDPRVVEGPDQCFDNNGNQRARYRCKLGWQGEGCDVDVDECTQKHYEPGCMNNFRKVCEQNKCDSIGFALESPMQCNQPYWVDSVTGQPSGCDRIDSLPLTTCVNLEGSWDCGTCSFDPSCCNPVPNADVPANTKQFGSIARTAWHPSSAFPACNGTKSDGRDSTCESNPWTARGCTGAASENSIVAVQLPQMTKCKISQSFCTCKSDIRNYPVESSKACVRANNQAELTILVNPKDRHSRLTAGSGLTSSSSFVVALSGEAQTPGLTACSTVPALAWNDAKTKYQAEFNCAVAGTYSLRVHVGDSAVADSPYQVLVLPGIAKSEKTKASLVSSDEAWCSLDAEGSTRCRILPSSRHRVKLKVHDEYGNERQQQDGVTLPDVICFSVEVAPSQSSSALAPSGQCSDKKADWDVSSMAYHADLDFDRREFDDEYDFDVHFALNGGSWQVHNDVSLLPSTASFRYVLHSTFNSTTCAKADCDHTTGKAAPGCVAAGCAFHTGEQARNRVELMLDWFENSTVEMTVARVCPDDNYPHSGRDYWEVWPQCGLAPCPSGAQCGLAGKYWNMSADIISVTKQPSAGHVFDVKFTHPGVYNVSAHITNDDTAVPQLPPVLIGSWYGDFGQHVPLISVLPGPAAATASFVHQPLLQASAQLSGGTVHASGVLGAQGEPDNQEYRVNLTTKDIYDNNAIGNDEIMVEITRVHTDDPRLDPSDRTFQKELKDGFSVSAVTAGICEAMHGCTVTGSDVKCVCTDGPSPSIIPRGSRTGLYSFDQSLSEFGVFSLSAWVCSSSTPTDCLSTNINRSSYRVRNGSDFLFTVCPQNTVLAGVGSADGTTTVGSQLSHCVCKQGFFSISGRGRNCQACSSGQFASGRDARACEPCAAGTSCDCTSGGVQVDRTQCTANSWSPACSSCTPCPPGRYQNQPSQATCKRCQDGFYCGKSAMTWPLATKGYWVDPKDPQKSSVCKPAEACPGSISIVYSTPILEVDSSAFMCYTQAAPETGPPDDCLPKLGAQCTKGYTGRACAECCRHAGAGTTCPKDTSGKPEIYYRSGTGSGSLCDLCAHQSGWLVAGITIICAVVLGPLLFKLAQISRHLGALNGPMMSVINFFQSADLFANLDLHWPASWKAFVKSIAGVFNFALPAWMSFLNPQCNFELAYFEKFLLTMLSPFLLVGIMALAIAARYGLATLTRSYLRRSERTESWCGPCSNERLGYFRSLIQRQTTAGDQLLVVASSDGIQSAPAPERLASRPVSPQRDSSRDNPILRSVLSSPDEAATLPNRPAQQPADTLNLGRRVKGGADSGSDGGSSRGGGSGVSRPVSPELPSSSDNSSELSRMKKDYKTARGQTEKNRLKRKYLAAKRFVDLDTEHQGKLGLDVVAALIRKDFPGVGDDQQAATLSNMTDGDSTEISFERFIMHWDVEQQGHLQAAPKVSTSLSRLEPEPEPEPEPEQESEPEPEPEAEHRSRWKQDTKVEPAVGLFSSRPASPQRTGLQSIDDTEFSALPSDGTAMDNGGFQQLQGPPDATVDTSLPDLETASCQLGCRKWIQQVIAHNTTDTAASNHSDTGCLKSSSCALGVLPDFCSQAARACCVRVYALQGCPCFRLKVPPDLLQSMAHFDSAQYYGRMESIVLVYLLVGYVALVSAAMAPLGCQSLYGGSYMVSQPSIECDWCGNKNDVTWRFGNVGYLWLATLAWMFSIMYGLGIPAMMVYIMYSHSENIKHREYTERYGFLSNKMREDWYAWEVCIIFRK